MEISEKIRNARRKKGLSQRKLGIETGISLGAIQGYEQGRYKPKYAQAKKLSDILEIPVNDLIDPVVLNLNHDIIELFTGSGNLKEVEFSAEDEVMQTSLRSSFYNLNTTGKKKLADYAEDLTKIPEYRAAEPNAAGQNHQAKETIAAHARTDVERTPEGVQHDLDIMNDGKNWE